MEDYIYVLDYLPKGRADLPPYKRQPIVYGIGEAQFTLQSPISFLFHSPQE